MTLKVNYSSLKGIDEQDLYEIINLLNDKLDAHLDITFSDRITKTYLKNFLNNNNFIELLELDEATQEEIDDYTISKFDIEEFIFIQLKHVKKENLLLNHNEIIDCINNINTKLNKNLVIKNNIDDDTKTLLSFINETKYYEAFEIEDIRNSRIDKDLIDFYISYIAKELTDDHLPNNENDIKDYIEIINDEFDEHLNIDDNYQTNAETLLKYLNQHNFAKKYNIDLNTYELNDDDFIKFIYEIKALKQSYEDNYKAILERDSIENEIPSDHDHDISFEYDQQKENEIQKQISIANEALHKALEIIKTKEHLPRLKSVDKSLIETKYYFPENEELYNYLEQNNPEFNSKHDDFLMINLPKDFDKAVEAYQHYSKYTNQTIEHRDQITNEPIQIYYYNDITSLDEIKEELQNVFKIELKPFKIHVQLSGVFEQKEYDFITDEEKYSYEARDIKWKNYRSSIPIIVKDQQNLEDVMLYIESILHSYETTSSSSKLTIVGSISFTISRMRKVTGKIKDLPIEFIKNELIITDNIDDNLCFYRFLAICLDQNLSNKKLANITNRTNAAKKLLLNENNIEFKSLRKLSNSAKDFINKYKGTTYEEMKDLVKKYHLNIDIYSYYQTDKSCYYDLEEQWFNDKSYKTYSALLYTKDSVIHIMYITNAESLTGIHICPKCHSYVHYSSQNLKRFYYHRDHCDGIHKKNFIPTKESLPYCPHILNNSIYEYCLAYNLEWKPEIYYMTYDFETMEEIIDKSVGKATTLNSKLVPLSVSSCIKTAKKLITKHFSLRDSSDFIKSWIKFLFESSLQIYEDKVAYMSSFMHLEEKDLQQIDKNLNVITVFGFNSSRFDSNLFKEYFNVNEEKYEWTIDSSSLIGTISSLKQFILVSKSFKTRLRFIDAQNFVAGGSLKQFGVDFGGEDNSIKGIFPY